jgi:flavin-dependent dehydrogenase
MESRLNQLAIEPASRGLFEGTACESTLTLQDAAAIDWDVVVIGAGPTGSLAARQLALPGLRILLVDRSSFPREKVCGGCISGLGCRILESVGLQSLLDSSVAVPLRRLELAAAGRRISLDLPAGAAISRFQFDARLVREAIRSGAAFIGGASASVRGLSEGCGFRIVTLQDEDAFVRVGARMVISADGLSRSSLKQHRAFASRAHAASRIGIGATLPAAKCGVAPEAVLMSVARDGYVGMVRLPDGALNLAAAVDPRLVRRLGPASSVREILMQAGATPPADLEMTEWRGTGLLTRHSPRMCARRLLVLGDAAGYIEPFTGEGMTWGMLAAVLAAPLVDEWLDRDSMRCGDCVALRQESARLTRAWTALYRTHIVRRQRNCRVLSGLLRHPVAVRAALGLISLAPNVAKPLIAHFWDSGQLVEQPKRVSHEGSIDAVKLASR